MEKHELCLGTGMGLETELIDQLDLIKSVGFDCAFIDWDNKLDFAPLAQKAARLGLRIHSLHAPFYGMDDIWDDKDGELAQKMIDDIIKCTDVCSEYDIPIMICHTIIGMDHFTPNEIGLERIAPLVENAAKKGITVAFENTEGEMYLNAVLEKFGESENVGFCFDSGHEMCYNFSRDMLAKYGKFIVSTHLNDNLGMKDESDMTFLDDYHLLPFDGKADWNGIAERLHKCNYNSTLTFEVVKTNKPGRSANSIYDKLTDEEYVAIAFEHADKFRTLFEKI